MKLSETQDYKALPFRGRWAIDNIIEYTKEIAAEKDRLEKQVESLSNFHPAQKLKPYIGKPNIWEEEKDNWGYSKKGANGWAIQKPVITPEQLQQWLKQNEPIYQENVKICELNKKASLAAFKFMERLGIPQKKYDYPSGRSKKKVEMACSWVGELNSFFATSCEYGWEQEKRWVAEEIKKINEYFEKQRAEEHKKKLAQETEQKAKNLVIYLAELNSKYKLNIPPEKLESYVVRTEILKLSKYLYLAHYLAKNRGDWNDGCSYAETGLNYFVSKPEENYKTVNDSAIYDNIQSYISDWGGDGRVFRDCEFNYDYLFGVVKENTPDLYQDYFKLQELCGSED